VRSDTQRWENQEEEEQRATPITLVDSVGMEWAMGGKSQRGIRDWQEGKTYYLIGKSESSFKVHLREKTKFPLSE
jgi:hypothetical protein